MKAAEDGPSAGEPACHLVTEEVDEISLPLSLLVAFSLFLCLVFNKQINLFLKEIVIS